MNRRTFPQSSLAGVAFAALPDSPHAAGRNGDLNRLNQPPRRTGLVRLDDHALMDDQGAFLGLGVTHFTALWRYRHDRARLESDLAFLAHPIMILSTMNRRQLLFSATAETTLTTEKRPLDGHALQLPAPSHPPTA